MALKCSAVAGYSRRPPAPSGACHRHTHDNKSFAPPTPAPPHQPERASGRDPALAACAVQIKIKAARDHPRLCGAPLRGARGGPPPRLSGGSVPRRHPSAAAPAPAAACSGASRARGSSRGRACNRSPQRANPHHFRPLSCVSSPLLTAQASPRTLVSPLPSLARLLSLSRPLARCSRRPSSSEACSSPPRAPRRRPRERVALLSPARAARALR